MTFRSLLASCVTLSAVLLATAPAAHGDDAPATSAPTVATDVLRVRVHGALDGAAIASAIGMELGVATTLVDRDAACTAPCVAITVDERARASIAVVLTTTTQQRAIELPANAAAAAEVVALVVGNLARDEAGALLAELARPASDPEATASLAPAPVFAATLGEAVPDAPVLAPPIRRARPAPAPVRAAPRATRFGLGLVPVLGIDVSGPRGTGGVAIDVVLGGRRRLAAFNVAGVGSIVTEDLVGTQIAGAFATAGRVEGGQAAGALAVAGPVHGVQIAGALAIATEVRGAQIGGALALTTGDASAQIGGALAIAGGDVDTQVAGAVNVAGKRVLGVQVAGALNLAGEVRGTQIAGAVNIARRVDGVQVGVVNIAGGGDGVSIGLLNLVRGGRTELEATLDNRAVGTLVLRHGSRRWHNVYGVGGHADSSLVDREVSDRDVWMYGLGMGPSWKRGAATVDVEAMAWHVVYGGDFTSELDLLNQLRVVVGYPIGPATVVVGAALNVYVTSDQTRDGLTAKRMTTPALDDRDLHVQIWPTGFVGLRL